MFYEGVRKIVFVVAVQGTVFTKDLENFQQNFLLLPELTMWKLIKTISLDTVHEMNLIKNELVLHLSLTKMWIYD